MNQLFSVRFRRHRLDNKSLNLITVSMVPGDVTVMIVNRPNTHASHHLRAAHLLPHYHAPELPARANASTLHCVAPSHEHLHLPMPNADANYKDRRAHGAFRGLPTLRAPGSASFCGSSLRATVPPANRCYILRSLFPHTTAVCPLTFGLAPLGVVMRDDSLLPASS